MIDLILANVLQHLHNLNSTSDNYLICRISVITSFAARARWSAKSSSNMRETCLVTMGTSEPVKYVAFGFHGNIILPRAVDVSASREPRYIPLTNGGRESSRFDYQWAIGGKTGTDDSCNGMDGRPELDLIEVD